jgi:hypothetical protein
LHATLHAQNILLFYQKSCILQAYYIYYGQQCISTEGNELEEGLQLDM